ncbi:MAG: mannose-1-phosphate guanylyltransferase [Clostridium sp.]|uniref:mannose-1-phosphate guanylyltransferase n=1 Tax=Clostridium sp. TaxID=1506 RepID=UPI0030513900
MLCALIMAGGKGTRFWPLSTEKNPKQFLNLLGEDTMVQMTVKRLLPLIPMERIFAVTSEEYIDILRKQLPYLKRENIIVEPVGRNTAPCIALSALHISKIYKEATMLVLPSDHLIRNENAFLEVVDGGAEFIEKNKEAIITIGIKPTRAETGYGYIRYKDKFEGEPMKVEAFVEKPNLQLAEKYMKSGQYLWNSGMFMWKCQHILNLMKMYEGNTYDILKEIAITKEEKYHDVLEQRYKDVDSISVDFAIMEKAENIYVIPGELGWDDIGSWKAIERYGIKDDQDNIIIGNVRAVKGNGNIIIGKDKPIIISDVDNMVIVESEELIYIGKKEDIESIAVLKARYNL